MDGAGCFLWRGARNPGVNTMFLVSNVDNGCITWVNGDEVTNAVCSLDGGLTLNAWKLMTQLSLAIAYKHPALSALRSSVPLWLYGNTVSYLFNARTFTWLNRLCVSRIAIHKQQQSITICISHQSLNASCYKEFTRVYRGWAILNWLLWSLAINVKLHRIQQVEHSKNTTGKH